MANFVKKQRVYVIAKYMRHHNRGRERDREAMTRTRERFVAWRPQRDRTARMFGYCIK
jgi:hypothetical protein